MRKVSFVFLVVVVSWFAFQAGCMDRKPAPVCPVPTELNQNAAMIGGFEGVDMLVVVDNSGSMAEEQQILATAFFPLVNALVNPLPGWPYSAADNVRIAVVSSDMGLQWGGNAYSDGDGWPGTPPCTASGDNGKFETYSSGKTVNIQDGKIPCDESNAQCPTGWECTDIDEDTLVGTCAAPGGDGTNQSCPDLNATWAETTLEGPNPGLAFQVACLSSLGTNGCGFEQQLQAAAKGLNRDDQAEFIRPDALLAVLVVSDEEDCSIEDQELFAVPEIQDLGDGKVNVACGNHPDYLYAPESYYNTFVKAKDDIATAVVFAAIVGVPKDEACEGPGNQITNCLDHEDMELDEVLEGDPAAYFFSPACTREEGSVEVTKARPGRRYVELALEFQNMGYVYSICNKNWDPAMEDIAKLIAENLAGTCYPKPLDWDPTTKQAKCDVVVEYIDEDDCPKEFEDNWEEDDFEPIEEKWTDADDVEHTSLFCPLPRLAAEKDCAEIDPGDLGDFGWYYCENLSTENFPEACEDGIDNDDDGDVDCDDEDCMDCSVCPGGTGVNCSKTCKYVVTLTDEAKQAVAGQQISVQCIQQFSFEDPNCQENTKRACNNERDDDGNGVWDCNADLSGDPPHGADANCCPLEFSEDGLSCKPAPETFDYCTKNDESNPPDACEAAAAQFGCKLE